MAPIPDSILHTRRNIMEIISSMHALGALAFFFVSAILWIFLLSPAGTRRRLRKNGFDGPPPRFPFGNLMEMSKKGVRVSSSPLSPGELSVNHDIHSTVFPYFHQWRKNYGKVFVYWLGTEPFLYVAEPEFLKQVTYGALAQSWGKPNLFKHDRRPMFGNGLVMVEGDDWAHHRHTVVPAFSPSNLNKMVKLMVDSTTNMLEQWSKNMELGRHEIDVEDYIIRNAAEIIAKASFGISGEDGEMVFEKLQTLQVLLFKTNRLVGVPFSKLFSFKQIQEARKLGIEIDQLLLSIINSRKGKNCDHYDDLLSLLLARKGDGQQQSLTTRELIDECKTFFFGGHETTALALIWSLLLLALYPDWQDTLRNEIMEISRGEPLDSTMIPKLVKMGWVFNEVLRLYSAAPNVQRQAREDVKVGEAVIPKGTNLWVDVVAMNHDRELWGDDVNEFKPERFMTSINGGCKHRMGFLPFGFGARVCVGRNLSAMEYKIVLSLILRKFKLSVAPSYLHCPKVMLTLRPSHGVPLIIRPL